MSAVAQRGSSHVRPWLPGRPAKIRGGHDPAAELSRSCASASRSCAAAATRPPARATRARGKLFVRERIDRLLDPGSPFLELSPLAAWELYDEPVPAAGIVTGVGRVEGAQCVVVANDATVKGGTYYPVTVKKHLRAQRIAAENRLPCVYLVDSGGAYLPLQDEVFPDREHFGRIFFNQARMSAAGIPQLSAVMGSCTAGGAYVPAMSDETVIVRGQGTIFLGGPPLVKAATGEVVSAEELGGGDVHARRSGVADHLAADDDDALRILRSIVAHDGAAARPPCAPPDGDGEEPHEDPAELLDVVPADLRTPYDVREVIARLVDRSRLHEFKARYGETLVCGFAHVHGRPGRDPRQQRDPVLGVGAQGRALHPAVRGAPRAAAVPAERRRLHGRPRVREPRDRQGRRQDGHRRVVRDGAQADGRSSAARSAPATTGCAGAPTTRASCGRGRTRASRSWAASRPHPCSRPCAATRIEARGEDWPADEEEAVQGADPRRATRRQGSPYYATARLWDDGVIDPLDTRRVLGLALAVCARAPGEPGRFGVCACDGLRRRPRRQPRGDRGARAARGARTRAAHRRRLLRRRPRRAARRARPTTALRIGPPPAAESYLSIRGAARRRAALGRRAPCTRATGSCPRAPRSRAPAPTPG